ncbi:MAG: PIG-L deacetylase family protein [Roseiflexaceae bacterium]|jgi:LmbE family N-acetylglucosaminyl deacetylase
MTEVKRALAIGAHPDDAEFGAGGTLARLAREGWEITYIVVTNGNKGTHDRAFSPFELSATREIEQRKALDVLGGKTHAIHLRYNDGELESSAALRLEMALYIRVLKPNLVFSHDPWKQYMWHPDHRAVGFAVIDGLVSARDHLFVPGMMQVGIDLWRPETLYLWAAEQPDHFEDITNTLDIKIASLREHHTQLDNANGWEDRVRTRAAEIGAPHGFAAAEGFKKMIV